MKTAFIWITRAKGLALSVADTSLISRWTKDGGETWSGGKVEYTGTGVRDFWADYFPAEHRIRVLTWFDFRLDENLGLHYINDGGPVGL